MGCRARLAAASPALVLAVCAITLAWPSTAQAVGDERFVVFAPAPRASRVAANGTAAPIVVDSRDFAGVRRAAGDLQADVFRVAAVRPTLVTDRSPKAVDVVVIGTLGRSRLIGQLVDARKLDVGSIRGRWESSIIQVVERPWPGVDGRWSLPAAISAARSSGSTRSRSRWASRPGTGGPTCPSGTGVRCSCAPGDTCAGSRRCDTGGSSSMTRRPR